MIAGAGRSPPSEPIWMIEGPAVAELQKLFLEAWTLQNGPKLSRNFSPELNQQGEDLVQVIGNRPGEKKPAIYVMYLSAISNAERSIHLTNPYFVPDRQMDDGKDSFLCEWTGAGSIGIFQCRRDFLPARLKRGEATGIIHREEERMDRFANCQV